MGFPGNKARLSDEWPYQRSGPWKSLKCTDFRKLLEGKQTYCAHPREGEKRGGMGKDKKFGSCLFFNLGSKHKFGHGEAAWCVCVMGIL